MKKILLLLLAAAIMTGCTVRVIDTTPVYYRQPYIVRTQPIIIPVRPHYFYPVYRPMCRPAPIWNNHHKHHKR